MHLYKGQLLMNTEHVSKLNFRLVDNCELMKYTIFLLSSIFNPRYLRETLINTATHFIGQSFWVRKNNLFL